MSPKKDNDNDSGEDIGIKLDSSKPRVRLRPELPIYVATDSGTVMTQVRYDAVVFARSQVASESKEAETESKQEMHTGIERQAAQTEVGVKTTQMLLADDLLAAQEKLSEESDDERRAQVDEYLRLLREGSLVEKEVEEAKGKGLPSSPAGKEGGL